MTCDKRNVRFCDNEPLCNTRIVVPTSPKPGPPTLQPPTKPPNQKNNAVLLGGIIGGLFAVVIVTLALIFVVRVLKQRANGMIGAAESRIEGVQHVFMTMEEIEELETES